MKKGKSSILELAQEIERQRDARKDYIADTRLIEAVPVDAAIERGVARIDDSRPERDVELRVPTNGNVTRFPMTEVAHRQIGTKLGIPAKFYERMRKDHPDLLAQNMNGLMQREPERRMLRTLDSNVRAYLSDKFRPLDNDELLESILPVLTELDVEILSCEVTATRMYLKFSTMKLEGDVGVGDTIRAGGVISNSEVGLGTIKIADLDYRLICLNGMVREVVARQTHVGRHTGIEGLDASEFFKDETRVADDRALFLKLRDTVAAMFRKDRFEARLAQYRAAKEETIERPIEVVEVVSKRFALPQGQRDGVLTALLRDGDLSKWGLANAVTRASQDVTDYDAASDLEVLGGKIIELPKNTFAGITAEATRIAEAKAS